MLDTNTARKIPWQNFNTTLDDKYQVSARISVAMLGDKNFQTVRPDKTDKFVKICRDIQPPTQISQVGTGLSAIG